MPRIRPVSFLTFCLKRSRALTAMRRFGSCALVKLKPRNLRTAGRATALFVSLTLSLSRRMAGNVYLADSGNHRIRKVSPDGIIQTIAGNGLAGNSGDGGPAIQAAIGVNIYSMRGMAIDANGVLYLVVDDLVRAISPGGIITTIAGTGVAGTAGDGGSAVNAQLADPSGVAVDSAGNVFISIAGTGVYGVSAIRKISPGGIITTIAGSLGEGFSGDGGPAARAQFQGPAGVAVDG